MSTYLPTYQVSQVRNVTYQANIVMYPTSYKLVHAVVLSNDIGVGSFSIFYILYTHACMHTDVCMHVQPMQTYISYPDMKIIKIKASDLYEKTKQIYIYIYIYDYAQD